MTSCCIFLQRENRRWSYSWRGRRSSLKKGKIYICGHNLIFSCYCTVAYVTGCGPPCNYCKVIPISCKSDPEYNLPVSKTASSSRNLQQIFVFIMYGGFSDLCPHPWHLWSTEASSTPLLLLYTYILLNHWFPPFTQKFLKWCEEQ